MPHSSDQGWFQQPNFDAFPNFLAEGYQIQQELGHNRAGGRVTYLATQLQTQQPVVIKQFQFAKSGTSWADYDAYQREIQLLKQLDHPGIPRYLDAFQTEDGFCMVQEYKQAESLASSRSFNPDQIRTIAIAALEVLIYLQNRIPPVIHRDLKPENILVDGNGQVYLIDFGFARVGDGEVGVSSVVKGTLGFMPPEQLFNRQLTEASDLYGLGMTLICLLTATPSDRIGDLVDISYRVSFKHLVPKLNIHWVNWLEKMVEPRLKDRYKNALAALDAIPVTPVRPPEAQFSASSLEFRANQLGELLDQPIYITNPIPETTLEGYWEVAAHPHDPPGDRYRWILVDPPRFADNQVECLVSIDTRYLMAGKTYQRQLLFHANTLAKTYPVQLHIKTAAAPYQASSLPYGTLIVAGLFLFAVNWLVAWLVLVAGTVAAAKDIAGFGALAGTGIGLELAAWLMRSSGWRAGATASTIAAIGVGLSVVLSALTEQIAGAGSAIVVGAIAGCISGTISGMAIGTVVERLLSLGSSKTQASVATLLTASLAASLALCLTTRFENPSAIGLLTLSALGLLTGMVHLQLRQMNARFSLRRAERFAIKP
jgi:serine/threonine protein kinase